MKKLLIVLVLLALTFPTIDAQAKRNKCGPRCRARQEQALILQALDNSLIDPGGYTGPANRPSCGALGCVGSPGADVPGSVTIEIPMIEPIYVNPNPEPSRPHIQ